VVQDKQKVDNDALYALIHKLQNDLTTKFDRLSEQVGDLRVLVLQTQAADQAHDLPSKVEQLSGRLGKLEIEKAAERDLPAKVEDHDKRLKTVEKREDEREGRRKLFDTLSVVAALLGGFLTIVQLYQWLKGR
jgi:peptidoglycan hydrolase CwlO-like protein